MLMRLLIAQTVDDIHIFYTQSATKYIHAYGVQLFFKI